MIAIVPDTNTIISGLFWAGPPRAVYIAVATQRVRALTTSALLNEFDDVIRRAKFAKQLSLRGWTPDSVLQDWLTIVEVVTLAVSVPPDAVRDPKDVKVLACAVGGKADYIVSGDKDLLDLGQYAGIPILSAPALLAVL